MAVTYKPPKCPLMEDWIKKTWYIYYLHTHTHTHWNITQPQKWNNATCSYMNGPAASRLSYWVKQVGERHSIAWDHWFVESKTQHRWTCLQNGNRLTDIEDRLWLQERAGLGAEASRCKPLHIERMNKVLLQSTGNYIQYPVISHNGNGIW